MQIQDKFNRNGAPFIQADAPRGQVMGGHPGVRYYVRAFTYETGVDRPRRIAMDMTPYECLAVAQSLIAAAHSALQEEERNPCPS